MKTYYVAPAAALAVAFLFISPASTRAADAPFIPSSFHYYGFVHVEYDAGRNDLQDFTSYTKTGFASSPEQVPLLVAAGFKNIIYITNHFSPGYSPLLKAFVTNEGIQLQGTAVPEYDYRTVPNYRSKIFALYKQQLNELKATLTANGTLDKIDLFYIADEPALHRNYMLDQDFVNTVETTFKSVFPGKLTTMAFAEDRSGTSPFRGPHFDPPSTLDVIGVDPYFADSTSIGCSEDAVRQFLYTTNPNSTVGWAARWGKPIYLIGDAMLRNGTPLPSCYVKDTFNIAKNDPRILGLSWFTYDAQNLGSDGVTTLTGAANSPTLVSLIKSLTTTNTPFVPLAPSVPVTNAPGTGTTAPACLQLPADISYRDNDATTSGTSSGDVGRLQQFLVAHGWLKVSPTGYFGPATYRAVSAFQTANDIARTGNVGPATRAAIASATGCSTADGAGAPQWPNASDKPQAVFTQTTPSTNINEPFSVSWSATNATSCIFETNGNDAGWVVTGSGLTGAQAFTLSAPGTYLGRLTCKGASGTTPLTSVLSHSVTATTPPTAPCAATQTNVNGTCVTPKPTIVVPPVALSPVIQSFAAAPASIVNGQSTTISWSASNATQCFGQDMNLGTMLTLNSSGSISVAPTATTNYKLRCINVAGTSTEKVLAVAVAAVTTQPAPATAPTGTVNTPTTPSAPVITLTKDTPVAYGGTATIVWSVTPASANCTASGGTLGTGTIMNTSGSWTTPPLYTTTQYGMKCTDATSGLSSVAYVQMSVPSQTSQSSAPVISTTGSGPIPYGGRATLTWSVTPSSGVTCVASGGELSSGTPVATSGSWTSSPLYTSTQYALRCTDATGLAGYGYATITVPTQTGSVLGTSVACLSLPSNLHRGAESKSVTALQTFLQSAGLLNEVSGFYGDKTVAAVKAYQKGKRLPTTGMVYTFTRRAIQADTCK